MTLIPVDDIDADDETFRKIGEIGNYYGELNVFKAKDGKCYWYIENYSCDQAEEIPKYLYDTLLKFKKERERTK